MTNASLCRPGESHGHVTEISITCAPDKGHEYVPRGVDRC